MVLKPFVVLALLAFRFVPPPESSCLANISTSSPLTAAIPPNEECGCTKTVFQTVTETSTKILCETSSPSIVTISTSTSSTSTLRTSEITTIIETTRLPSGISESQKPVPSSTTVAPTITTTTITSPPIPPYANSTTSISTSQINGTTVSRGGGLLSTITRTGAFYSSYPFPRPLSGTGLSTLSTLQTSISQKPPLSHSSFSITTDSSSKAVPATSSQTTNPLTSSASTTTSLAPTPSGVSTFSHIPYTFNPFPSSTAVNDNSGVFSSSTTSRTESSSTNGNLYSTESTTPVITSPSTPSSTSSSAYLLNSMTTSSTPSSSEPSTPAVHVTTVATKEPSKPEYSGYGSKINKRHRGGGENAEEGEGYWGNARRV